MAKISILLNMEKVFVIVDLEEEDGVVVAIREDLFPLMNNGAKIVLKKEEKK